MYHHSVSEATVDCISSRALQKKKKVKIRRIDTDRAVDTLDQCTLTTSTCYTTI